MNRRRNHSRRTNLDGLEMARRMYGPGRNEHPGEPKPDAGPLEADHGVEAAASTATANQESKRD